MNGMSIEKARSELQAAMSGPAGRQWSYAPAISAVLDALEQAEQRIAEQRQDPLSQPCKLLEQEPVADVVAWRKEGEKRTCDIRWRKFDVAPGPLYTRPPLSGAPDGYCILPLKLTAANGAKGALSGEFHVIYPIVCQECGGEGCENCNDEGGWQGEILIGWEMIKRIYEAAVKACALPESDNIS